MYDGRNNWLGGTLIKAEGEGFPTKQPRVLAVIVAYNSPEALGRNLGCLYAQTHLVDRILVVDNSEPAPVDVSLFDAKLLARTTVLNAEGNTGPAGGFALGLGVFLGSSDYTHAWLMDDDSYPDPSALESLLNVAKSHRPGQALFPSAVYEASGVAMNYPGWSGVLLDRLAVQQAGLPMAELFWWAEDTEYLQFRLPRKGVLSVRVPEAVVLYDLIRRVGGRPAWKYYYETRNTIWLRIHAKRGFKAWKLARPLVKLLGSAALSKSRRANLMMCAKGIADGCAGRLGASVRPPIPRTLDTG